MLGACLIISLRTFAGNYTEYWTLILGLMMMLTIFFLPKGVFGFVNELFRSKAPDLPLEESSHAAD
jgi:branched-chain amino acid transport system permease protein